MEPRIRLGGFKILREIRGFTVQPARNPAPLLPGFCSAMARARVNLPFLVAAGEEGGIYAALDKADEARALSEMPEECGAMAPGGEESAALSIFPHREHPEILPAFLKVVGRGNLPPQALALSHSAVTAVLPASQVDQTAEDLFVPFGFSSYRTPADWKAVLTQNQPLYREVVASYQEKRPGVYGIAWTDGLVLLRLRIGAGRLENLAHFLWEVTEGRYVPAFLAGYLDPCQGEFVADLCCPAQAQRNPAVRAAQALAVKQDGACVLSMNGPHFGDRYGIALELLEALNIADVNLLSMGCSVASIYAVIYEGQVHEALKAIKNRFEVPNITRRKRPP